MEFEALPKSGYTSKTPKRFNLNAGALLKNLKWIESESKWNGDLLGATSGGSSISLVNTYRQAQIDGVFAPTVGSDSIEESTATFEINFIEWTAQNLKMAILGDVKESDGTKYPIGYDVITSRRKIEISDYVENLAYAGTIAGSDKPIVIIMHHAIATSGLEFEPQDKQESIYTVTFEGRASAEDIENTSLPVTILFPKETEETGEAAEPLAALLSANKIDGAPDVPESKEEVADSKSTKGATK